MSPAAPAPRSKWRASSRTSAGSGRDAHHLARRHRLCQRRADGVVRGQRGHYVFGLARNSRLEAALAPQLKVAKMLHGASGHRARVFRDFRYQTLDSWSRERRVVGKAEHNQDGANPRFIVTTLPRRRYDAQSLYRIFTARVARPRTASASNSRYSPIGHRRPPSRPISSDVVFRIRLYSARYRASRRPARHLFRRRRRRHHSPETAQARARVRISVRRIHFAIATSCPDQAVFACAYDNLSAPLAPPDPRSRSRKTEPGSAARFARDADARA